MRLRSRCFVVTYELTPRDAYSLIHSIVPARLGRRGPRERTVHISHLISYAVFLPEWQCVRGKATQFDVAATNQNDVGQAISSLIGRIYGELGRFTTHSLTASLSR